MAFNAIKQQAKDLRNGIKIVAEIVPKEKRIKAIMHKLEGETSEVKKSELLDEKEQLEKSINERLAYALILNNYMPQEESQRKEIYSRLLSLSASEYFAALVIFDSKDYNYIPVPSKVISEEKIKRLKIAGSVFKGPDQLLKEILS